MTPEETVELGGGRIAREMDAPASLLALLAAAQTAGFEPGSPSWPGVGQAIVRKFPFAFDTAGLLTAAALFTPTIDDVLLNVWVETRTAWDGTTPKGDVLLTGVVPESPKADAAVIQHALNQGADQNFTSGFAGSTREGSTLVVGLEFFGQSGVNPVVNSISDGVNTYTLAPGSTANQDTGINYPVLTAFYYVENALATAGNLIAVDLNHSAFWRMSCWELTPSLFVDAVAATGGSTDPDAGSIAAPRGSVAMVLVTNDGTNDTFSPGSQWTTLMNSGAGGGSTYSGFTVPVGAQSVPFAIPKPGSPPWQWASSGIVFSATPPSGSGGLFRALGAPLDMTTVGNNPSTGSLILPARFATTDPVKVVVSQDGTDTGADSSSTHGSADLYLVTATPA